MSEIWAHSSDVSDERGQARSSITVPVCGSKQAGRRERGDEPAVLAGLIKE